MAQVQDFRIEKPDAERMELFVGATSVGKFNFDQHGFETMKDAERLFENVAKALGAKLVTNVPA